MQRVARMKRELEEMARSPPHGISCWAKEDCLDQLEAQILGGDDTPYSGGVFKLDIQIPERYPFQPPQVRFVTPIYHPNIDTEGRICLDRLKMPPSGSWKPVMNVGSILTTIQLLMCDPNPEDPLMTDIAEEFKFKRPLFRENAAEWTRKYAMSDSKLAAASVTKEQNMKKSSPEEEDSSSSDSDSDNDAENITRTTIGAKRVSASPLDTALKENVKKGRMS